MDVVTYVNICIPMGSCTILHWEVVAHQGSCNTPGELWLWYITFKPQKLPLILGAKVLHKHYLFSKFFFVEMVINNLVHVRTRDI